MARKYARFYRDSRRLEREENAKETADRLMERSEETVWGIVDICETPEEPHHAALGFIIYAFLGTMLDLAGRFRSMWWMSNTASLVLDVSSHFRRDESATCCRTNIPSENIGFLG